MDYVENTETRFAHLLQPIRDLTKNWEVDVAAELADYLEELDDVCITFDGGKTTLNFAAAALLIQGSTCIYSRKVEHLYNLVFQTLDYISDRNKKRDKRGPSAEDGDADGGGRAAGHDRDDVGMDSLDDLSSEVSTNIDLSGEHGGRVNVVPLPPGCLIPPEAFEKQKLPLISLKGEVLGSCKDFRMNTFTPDALGIIRLFLEASRSNFLRDMLADAPWVPSSPMDGGASCPDDAGAAAGAGVVDVSGGDLEEGGENLPPLEDGGAEMEEGPEEHIDRQRAPGEGRVLRERRGIQPSEEEERNKRLMEKRAPTADPWRLHDPYAVFGEEKPQKTGKCYKVPLGLDDSGKRKRKGSSALEDFWSWYTGTYDPPEPRLKNGPFFKDLNYIYLRKMQEKLKTRRRILRKTGVFVSDEELRRTFLQEQEAGEEEEQLRHHDLQGADDDLSDNEVEPLGDAAAEGEPDLMTLDPQIDGMSYEDLVKKSVEQFLVNSQAYARETALSRRVKDWEDQIQPELLLQEERQAFDIHDYGDRIVAALSGVGQRRTLASIVRGMDNFEACKYMLASLQLANDSTVEIDKSEGLEESLDTMGLTLLSKHRARERFNKALKPSAASADPL